MDGESPAEGAQKGLGLGLHIAKGVAARHGFDFRISRPDAGGLEVEFRGKRRDPPDPPAGGR